MPVAEFAGRFNWGYDGVDLFAPYHGYGDPEAFKRFVDTAHGLGLGVVLDVVYNHLGADGNYLGHYSPDYFTERYKNEWGAAINFDGPGSGPVRELFIENARLLDPGVPSRRACGSMPRRASFATRGRTSWRRSPRGPGRRRRQGRSS